MTQNSIHIHETLLHRLDTLFMLAEDFSKHSTLLPELLVKTIRDTHRFTNQGISHLSSEEIVNLLNIQCSDQEKNLLIQIEHSLRKSKDYQELCDSYSKDLLLSIAHKLHKYLNKQG